MERYTLSLRMPSEVGLTPNLVATVVKLAEIYHFDDRQLFGIHTAFEEALTNAIKHGNRMDAKKYVTVYCELTDGSILIRIADEGTGFNIKDVPDCLADENLDKPSGRGLKLIEYYMSEVIWNRIGNEIEMRMLAPVAV